MSHVRQRLDLAPWRLAVSLFEIALWFALTAALVHVTWLLFRSFITGGVISAGLHTAWIAPGSYALLTFGAVALPVLVLFVWPAPIVWSAGVFSVAAVSLISALLLVRQLHPVAALFLALGLAARWAHAWRTPGTRPAFVRRTNLALMVLVAAGTAAAWLGPPMREASIERALPPAAVDAPNVLLIVLDTVRAKNLSLHGYHRPTTPRLDRWAREGTVFDYAIAPAPWTLPSHASFFTGISPTLLSARFLHKLDGDEPRLAEVLQQRGYVTAGFSGNNAYGTAEAGLGRGFQHYVSHRASAGQLTTFANLFRTRLWEELVGSRRLRGVLRAFWHFNLTTPYIVHGESFLGAPELRAQTLEWLAAHRERPFFVFLNLFDAHTQGRAPRHPILKFADGRQKVDRYDSAIAMIDEEIETVLESLRRDGRLDRTIVILTSDHGEQYGEHGLQEHANSLYLPLLHVPFVVRYPSKVPAGVRIGDTVSLVNMAATILDLAGAHGALPGRSLLEASRQGTAEPQLSDVERATSVTVEGPTQRGPIRSLIDDRWHYIRNGDGAEELYAYRADAAENTDLAKVADQAEVIKSMREALARMPPGYEHSLQ
jgi:arylsulfatase A-like enzyme